MIHIVMKPKLARILICLFFLTLWVDQTGCSLNKNRQRRQKHATSEDDEAGVRHITTLVRDFQRALSAKNFDKAAADLSEAEKSVKNASVITRGHPDFEDMATKVATCRPRLEQAIERDRIERRNAAIMDLINRGNQLMHQGKVILGELASRVPQDEDMSNLNEVIDALAAIEKEGESFLDDQRYKDHAKQRDELTSIVIGRRRQAQWQIQTTKAVSKTVKEATDAITKAQTATNTKEKISYLHEAADAFVACINALGDAESLGGYNAKSVLTTRLGTIAAGETKKRCLAGSNKLRLQADRLAVNQRISNIANNVDSAIAGLNKTANAADKLTATEDVILALAKCQAELEAIPRNTAYDKKYTVSTKLGTKFNGDKLQRACTNERKRLILRLGNLSWRKRFESMQKGLTIIKQRIDFANATKDAGAQIKLWQQVIENLSSCVESANLLKTEAHADKRFVLISSLGKLNVEGLSKQCERQRENAKNKLASAIKNQSIESFVKNCKADEIAIVQREGVPTQVIPVDGGRIFVYSKKGTSKKSFSFNAAGKSVNFGETWQQHVISVANEVARVFNNVMKAADGVSGLAASKEAITVLDICNEALTGTERHPGYKAKEKFATVLGKVTAVKLRSACEKHRLEIASTIPKLTWLAEVEHIRDRAVEAYMQVEEASSNPDPNKRVSASGAALGSYRECVERAEAMAKAPDADKKATVNGPFGPVTVLGLANACKDEIANAKATLDAAIAAQKFAHFLESCKSDESAVAQREGMPSRIESLGTGRVFIYLPANKKEKAKRFAFNANGARVDEAALRE
ncbi:MAG: hypothetical protein JW841_02920 [Deltaproteobacteria bacterium]|nr:hypothetical protein [Deltaproteobacteria bacterium]